MLEIKRQHRSKYMYIILSIFPTLHLSDNSIIQLYIIHLIFYKNNFPKSNVYKTQIFIKFIDIFPNTSVLIAHLN